MKIGILCLLFFGFGNAFDDDFNPYELVLAAQSNVQELDFTMPETLVARDPQELLNEVTDLQNQVQNLMVEIDRYVVHFNISTGPEAKNILSLINRLNTAENEIILLDDRIEKSNTLLSTIETTLEQFRKQLQCFKNSNCHPVPPTTYLPPAPNANCSTGNPNAHKVVTAANQTGQFTFLTRYNFGDNCTMTVQSKNGLYLNFTVSNFVAYGDGRLHIQPTEDSSTIINITGNGPYNGIRQQLVDIVAQNQLMFTVSYVALDVCQQPKYDCGYGTCYPDPVTNTPKCKCNGCYNRDSSGRCTTKKPDQCLQFGRLCTAESGGKCLINPFDCSYYCQCPNVSSTCTTKKYCDPNDTTCPGSKEKLSLTDYLLSKLHF